MQAACGPWRSAIVEHLVGRRHLEVERQGQLVHQPADIGVGDMAAILAKVRGDAVGAGLLRDQRGAHGIGMLPPRAFRTVAT